MPNRFLWALIGLTAVFSILKPIILGSSFDPLVPLISILAPILFVLFHAPRTIGWTRLALFFALTCVISWSYESLSIATGFPFGNYHYTDNLGPKLGTVPLLIMPAYFGVCYICWLISELLTNLHLPGKPAALTLSVVASFVMVVWDLSMDPARATVAQAWIWHDGGAYFGVPLVNFAGWFLCVLTIFLAYSAVSDRVKQTEPRSFGSRDALPIGLYAALFAEFAANIFWPHSGTVADATGHIWSLDALYQTLGLVSCFTMGFVIVMALVKLRSRAEA